MAASFVWAYGKKVVSWVLIFNGLLSIVLALGLLIGFYAAHWRLYQPYLLNANLLWAAILTSITNFFPTAKFGNVKVRRIRFHHFVYGFAILSASAILMILMPVSLLSLFNLNITSVDFNVERVFVLVGLTLIIDDFADISNITMTGLRFAKSKAYEKRRTIHAVQCLLFCVTFFVLLCITVWLVQNPKGLILRNLAVEGSLLVTSLTSFASALRKVWLKITP